MTDKACQVPGGRFCVAGRDGIRGLGIQDRWRFVTAAPVSLRGGYRVENLV